MQIPRKPIGAKAMTGAERQKRHREKIAKMSWEEEDNEKIRRNAKKYIDRLSVKHLYPIEALLYSLMCSYSAKDEAIKALKSIDITSFAKAMTDFQCGDYGLEEWAE